MVDVPNQVSKVLSFSVPIAELEEATKREIAEAYLGEKVPEKTLEILAIGKAVIRAFPGCFPDQYPEVLRLVIDATYAHNIRI